MRVISYSLAGLSGEGLGEGHLRRECLMRRMIASFRHPDPFRHPDRSGGTPDLFPPPSELRSLDLHESAPPRDAAQLPWSAMRTGVPCQHQSS